MVTTSKRWAIVLGLMIVAIAVVTQVVWSRTRPNANMVTALFSLGSPTPSARTASLEAPGTGGPATAATDPRATSARAGDASARAAPASATAGSETPERPRFDVVRVEPDGSLVVAGRAAPNAAVALLVSGQSVAETRADANGHFAMVPPALAPGGQALTLRQNGRDGALDSAQSVAVSVPEKGKAGLVVALAEPGKATKLLAVPTTEAPAAAQRGPAPGLPGPGLFTPGLFTPGLPTPGLPSQGKLAKAPTTRTASDSGLAIRSVELETGGGFYASGVAPPGTKLRVYLNNSHLADVIAGKESSWSVKIKKGLASGHYSVRADASTDGTTRVAQRAEVPFDVPAAAPAGSSAPRAAGPILLADASGAGDTSAATPGPIGSPMDAVIAEVKTTVVRSGDNLWDISRIQLGEGWRYTRIYAANVSQIRDPKLIFPGQVFVMPTHDDRDP